MRDAPRGLLAAGPLLAACATLLLLLAADAERPGPRGWRSGAARPASSPTIAPTIAPGARDAPGDAAPSLEALPSVAVVAVVASVGTVADPGCRRRLLRVRGQVVDASGATRAGARVELHGGHQRARRPGEGPATPPEVGEPFAALLLATHRTLLRARVGATRAGPDGRFEAVVQAGPLEGIDLLVVAAEDQDGAVALTQLEPRPDEDGLVDLGRLTLRLTSRLEVLARADGLPLEGATVEVHGPIPLGELGNDLPAALSAVTDAAGAAVLRHQGRPLAVHVRAPGRARVIRWLGQDGPLPATVRLEVELPAATEVRGVVRDARGAPLPGVQVSGAPLDQGLSREEATTDEEGRFALPSLATGAEYELTAWHPTGDHVEATVRLVPPATDVEVRLADASAIVLTLAGAERSRLRGWCVGVAVRRADPAVPGGWTPAAEARIERWDDEAPRMFVQSPSRMEWKLLARDQVRVVGLAPGRYLLHASSTFDGVSGWSDEVTARVGEEVTASATLATGVGVRGRLVDAARRPLPDVEVELRYDLPGLEHADRRRVATDAEGRFELARLVPEVEEVTLGRDGFEPRRVKLDAEGDLGDVLLVPKPK